MKFCNALWQRKILTSINMLPLLLLAILLGAFGLLAPVSLAEPVANAELSSNEALLIVQDEAWAPLAFIDKQGKPQGLLPDLWRKVAEKTDRSIVFELVDWQDTLQLVKGSPNAIHGGLFKSAERSNYLDFSDPIMQLRTSLFVHSGKAMHDILDIDDITTQVVGVTAGGYEEEFLRVNYPNINLQLFNNNEQLVRAVVAGSVMAFVADYPVGMYYLDQYTTPEQFRVLAVLYQQPIFAAVAKGNQTLLDEINKGLAEINSIELTAIKQKWINTTPVNVIPSWLLPSLAIFIAIAFLLAQALYNKRLNQRVNRVTSELLEQEQQVSLLTENMSDWVWKTNHHSQFVYVSPSIKKLLGYDAEELLGKTWGQILHPGEREKADALSAHILAAVRRGEIIDYKDLTLEVCLQDINKKIVWTETATRIFFDQYGNYLGSQGSSRNITERKQAEEAIRQLAFNDPLTHLPNRRLLSDRLRQAMAGCARHHQYCALFFLDLDNFKYINDNHGHDNGDIILQQVAQRLSANLRESDTVARFGSDEFALIAEYLTASPQEAKQQVLHLAIKMLELFDKDFILRETTCRLTTSIGIILFNTDQKSVDALIKQADLALYQAKANGRNQFFVADFTHANS